MRHRPRDPSKGHTEIPAAGAAGVNPRVPEEPLERPRESPCEDSSEEPCHGPCEGPPRSLPEEHHDGAR